MKKRNTNKLIEIIFISLFLNILAVTFAYLSKDNSKQELNFLSLIVFSPIMEELIFRYLLINLLKKVVENHRIIIFLSALIFSSFHIGNPVQRVYTFVLGYYLANLYYTTNKIEYPIISHIVFNAANYINIYARLFLALILYII